MVKQDYQFEYYISYCKKCEPTMGACNAGNQCKVKRFFGSHLSGCLLFMHLAKFWFTYIPGWFRVCLKSTEFDYKNHKLDTLLFLSEKKKKMI